MVLGLIKGLDFGQAVMRDVVNLTIVMKIVGMEMEIGAMAKATSKLAILGMVMAASTMRCDDFFKDIF